MMTINRNTTTAAFIKRSPGSSSAMEPKVISWGARSLYVGPALEIGSHRNGVAVLCAGLNGEIRSALGAKPTGRSWVKSRTALVSAGILHTMRFDASLIACLYLDPQDTDFATLAESMTSRGGLLIDHRQERTIIDLFEQVARNTIEPHALRSRAAAAFGFAERNENDPRVARIVDIIRRNPSAPHRLADLSWQVGLSETRLRHAFKGATGVPLSRFRVWSRMGAALRLIAAGATLTAAAHEAGFASSAHFSTAFRAMFGLPPSAFVRQKPKMLVV